MKNEKQMVFLVEKINSQGQGISHLDDGKVVFIDGVLPGEKVIGRIGTEKTNYALCDPVEIIESHPQRVVPPCEWYGQCGGCQLQHCSYGLQLELKKQILEDALYRIGKIDRHVSVAPCVPSPLTLGYRNKASFPLRDKNGSLMPGFFRKRSHNLVHIKNCILIDQDLQHLFGRMSGLFELMGSEGYDEKRHRGIFRHMILRKAVSTGEILLCLVVAREPGNKWKERSIRFYHALAEKVPAIKGFLINVNPLRTNTILGPLTSVTAGKRLLDDRLGDYSLSYDGTAFFQVNPYQAEGMFKYVSSEISLSGAKDILELYSGVGALTVFLAGSVRSITAVEDWPSAVDSMNYNLAKNRIFNVRAYCGKAEELISHMAEEGFDSVVLDPPRSGCKKEVLKIITNNIRPESIVYISCNPATLARDLGDLIREGYYIRKVQPFDMFPQTYHVETVVTLGKI
ncbi:MAG: 23S rRNA (uracil(1939)-C(5))-methyltransferase RlmD [Synergistales bacterium]|nr:23S rRNA (uracil(1939)-C(5))-methyltransferase RlmD [Synergistales bacterium]